ncbi:MAG: hypothetical protein DRJ47_06530 [Thermoprotei archaeon]|nr:MAG: hypothetical protein DRJ47_06530 [Thermoprotei archaeon]
MAILALSTGIDLGLIYHLSHYDKVYLFTDYISPFPEFEELALGRNLENIEPITILSVDLNSVRKVVAFDCYFGFLVELFRKLDIPVFGAGNESELENNRVLQKRSVPNPSPYEERTLDTLIPGKVIKINPIYRGSFETTVVRTRAELEFFKEMLKRNGGPLAEEITYLEEDVLDTKFEIGVDAVCLGEGIEFPAFIGIEQSKSTYMAVPVYGWEDVSRFPLYENTYALSEHLKKVKYKGFFSSEEIVTEQSPGTSYLIDVCMRAPFPLGSSYPKFFTNFADVVLGEEKPRVDARFVVSIPLSTRLADEYFVPAVFKDLNVFKNYICLQTFYKPKSQPRNALLLYFVKTYNTLGTVTLMYDGVPEVDRVLEDYHQVIDTVEIPDLIDESGTVIENHKVFTEFLRAYGYGEVRKPVVVFPSQESAQSKKSTNKSKTTAKDVLMLVERFSEVLGEEDEGDEE